MNKADFMSMMANELSEIYNKMCRDVYRGDSKPEITIEEAVRLGKSTPACDLVFSLQLYNAAYNDASNEYPGMICKNTAISTVFLAGKIAGIRQERAKRKKMKTDVLSLLEQESA